MRKIFRLFFGAEGTRPYIVLFALLLATLSEAVGISALLPAISIISGGPGSNSAASRSVDSVLSAFGLQPTLETILPLICLALVIKAVISFLTLTYAGVAAAKEIWSRLLASTDERPVQARAYYGLGRVALAERNPERADQLLRKVLEMDPDASTLAWSLVYLGKLADSQGEGEAAKQFYSKALAVAGVPDQVKREAEQGATGAFFRSRPPEAAEPEEEDEEDPDDLP